MAIRWGHFEMRSQNHAVRTASHRNGAPQRRPRICLCTGSFTKRLRRAMLDGKLGAGDRLPSSRELTQDLGLSRNTVVAAINQFSVEGYLVSRVGSGTYVNDTVPKAGQATGRSPEPQNAGLSRRGQALATTFCATQLEVQPFTPGIADFSAFPVALWQRLQNKHWRMTYPEMLDYSYSGGHAPLAPRCCGLSARFPQRAARRRSGHHHQWYPTVAGTLRPTAGRPWGHRVAGRPGLLGSRQGFHGNRLEAPCGAGRSTRVLRPSQ